jgi:hypothetical protein
MNPILFVAPFLGALTAVFFAIALRWKTGAFGLWKMFVTAVVFLVATVLAFVVIPKTGIRTCRGATSVQADRALGFIHLPSDVANVDVYSSAWNALEYTSFPASKDEYNQWCQDEGWAPAPSIDHLVHPLFVLDPDSEELVDLPLDSYDGFESPYISKDERFQAVYDPNSSRVLAWFIGR